MTRGTGGPLSITLIVASACAIVFGLILIVWMGLFSTALDSIASLLKLAQTWKTEEVGAHGNIITTLYNPFAVAFVALLGFTSLAALAVSGIWLWVKIRQISASIGHLPPTARMAAAGKMLETELTKIIGLIRTHMGSAETYSQALVNAQKTLVPRATTNQVQATIKLLIAENEKMQRETLELRRELETSKGQIENLQLSLSEAQEEGMKDSLTSVGNRRCFDVVLDKEVGEARNAKTSLCLIMCDIDHFKRFNDTFGHPIGDEILKLFARLLSDNVKGRDTVTRYGGEEFAVILPQTEVKDATSLAERMRRQFESKELTISKSGKKIGRMTASFGVVQLQDGEDINTFVQVADAKLYDAKRTGRNRVTARIGNGR